MEILRKNPREMLEITSAVIELKNVFDRLIGRLEMAEESLQAWRYDNKNL